MAIATIVRWCASIDAGEGAGSRAVEHALFCRLIWADSKHCHWPRASSDPSLEGLGDINGIGDNWPITVSDADVDVDLVTCHGGVTSKAPPPDAPGIVQGGGGCCAHLHDGAMAVTLEAAQAPLLGGCVGVWGGVDDVGQGPSLQQPCG
jgi:hypothetical protein